MKRYCETDIARYFPCGVGWGSVANGREGNSITTIYKCCTDEPKECNCHRLIDECDEIKVEIK